METQEEKKPQKKIEKPREPSKEIKALIEMGVALKMAVFHRTILSFGDPGAGTGGAPENALYSVGAKPGRMAKLWYTPHGLVTEQRGIYKIIPLANVSDTIVL